MISRNEVVRPPIVTELGKDIRILSIIRRQFQYAGEVVVVDLHGVQNDVHVLSAIDYLEGYRDEPRALDELARHERKIIQSLRGAIPSLNPAGFVETHEEGDLVFPGTATFKAGDLVGKLLFLPTKAKAEEVRRNLQEAADSRRPLGSVVETYGIISRNQYFRLFLPQG